METSFQQLHHQWTPEPTCFHLNPSNGCTQYQYGLTCWFFEGNSHGFLILLKYHTRVPNIMFLQDPERFWYHSFNFQKLEQDPKLRTDSWLSPLRHRSIPVFNFERHWIKTLQVKKSTSPCQLKMPLGCKTTAFTYDQHWIPCSYMLTHTTHQEAGK